MAKVTPGNLVPDAFNSLRGRVLTRVTPWGIIAQKWPRKRGPARTPYEYYRQSEFGYAARWAASPDALNLASAILLCEGSQNVPRDFLTAANMGVHAAIEMEDGTAFVPNRMVTPNAQLVLDQVTNIPGSWLFRSEQGWIGVLNPASRPLITTVWRETDAAAVNTTTFECTFTAAAIDENGAWDAAFPKRLTVPSTATYVRISGLIRMLSLTHARGYESGFKDEGGVYYGNDTPLVTVWTNNNFPSAKGWTIDSGWLPRPAVDWVSLWTQLSAAAATGYGAGTKITMECIY